MNRPQSESSGYVLKFISGKYQGGEFPVEMGEDIEIGRSSELDMVLVEDMVSRRHARITADGGQLEIEDFGSTNGTFVNGKKIDQTTLEEGDRILIGTSIIKLVERDEPVEEASGLEADDGGAAARQTHSASSPASGATAPQEPQDQQPQHSQQGRPSTSDHEETPRPESQPESKKTQAQPAVGQDSMPPDQTHAQEPVGGQSPNQSGAGAPTGPQDGGGPDDATGATLSGSISGLIEEVPLPDLLQLFSTSQKSGVLVVHHNDDVGKVYLRDGRCYYASINDDPDIAPRKAFFRMLAWEEGTFSLEQATDESFEDEINDSVENLLMEGMKQLDEIRNLGDDVPDYQETLQVNKPLVPPLRSLSDELLDTLQLVYNYNKVSTVLNKSLASDLETMQDIVHLLRKDYVSVEE